MKRKQWLVLFVLVVLMVVSGGCTTTQQKQFADGLAAIQQGQVTMVETLAKVNETIAEAKANPAAALPVVAVNPELKKQVATLSDAIKDDPLSVIGAAWILLSGGYFTRKKVAGTKG